jgi:hypothetical protein
MNCQLQSVTFDQLSLPIWNCHGPLEAAKAQMGREAVHTKGGMSRRQCGSLFTVAWPSLQFDPSIEIAIPIQLLLRVPSIRVIYTGVVSRMSRRALDTYVRTTWDGSRGTDTFKSCIVHGMATHFRNTAALIFRFNFLPKRGGERHREYDIIPWEHARLLSTFRYTCRMLWRSAPMPCHNFY